MIWTAMRTRPTEPTHSRLPALALALLLLAGIVLHTATARADRPAGDMPVETVTVETAQGRFDFAAEIAETAQQQARGLMYRETLADDAAMLFDFGAAREVRMWMRNTLVSLDMVFIRPDGTVHRVAEHTTPLSERIVPSNGPVSAVLEVRAGTADRIGLEPGDQVHHRIFDQER